MQWVVILFDRAQFLGGLLCNKINCGLDGALLGGHIGDSCIQVYGNGDKVYLRDDEMGRHGRRVKAVQRCCRADEI
jgi:hypothetical protein